MRARPRKPVTWRRARWSMRLKEASTWDRSCWCLWISSFLRSGKIFSTRRRSVFTRPDHQSPLLVVAVSRSLIREHQRLASATASWMLLINCSRGIPANGLGRLVWARSILFMRSTIWCRSLKPLRTLSTSAIWLAWLSITGVSRRRKSPSLPSRLWSTFVARLILSIRD